MCAQFSIDIGGIVERIWDATTGQLNYLRRPKARIKELHKAADRLRAKLQDINVEINHAEREGRTQTNEAQQWKMEMEASQGEETAIQEDYNHQQCLRGCSWNCFSINRRVTKKLDEINNLMSRLDTIQLTTRLPPVPNVHLLISDSIYGMDSYVEEILHYIAEENISIIGIYGMGGVGKTTLLKLINNHQKTSSMFDHAIWVVASKDCKPEKLQLDIAKRLGLTMEKDNDKEDNAIKLIDFLNNKSCLLLLDDIWERQDLQLLGMINSAREHSQQPKRKVVVFTTRTEQVCGEMRAEKRIQVKCLGPDEAWELFQKNVGGDVINSDAGINRIAKQIAQECAGLPLALITVGSAMSAKKSWEAWKYALTQLKNGHMSEISGKKEKDPMYSAFKLSYENLEDDNMRARLLCCSLWLKDWGINKEELIECWMGLGLIEEFRRIHEAYNMGYSHIDALLASCLLELDDEYNMVKMHDVIRDMTLWEASDCGLREHKWIVRAAVGLRQMPEEVDWREVERVSLMWNDITTLPEPTFNYERLSMLILKGNANLKGISGKLFDRLPNLGYLDLSYTGIKELPKEIAMLRQLRYLNLSYSDIKLLPEELGMLSYKLKYLLLRCTSHLTFVPKGTISKLSSLRLLDLYGSNRYNGLDEIECLQGCQKFIGISINTIANLHHLCSLQNVSTWQLQLNKMSDLLTSDKLIEGLLRSRNTRRCLEELSLYEIKMVELLMPRSLYGKGFDYLKGLRLRRLKNLTKIIWKEVEPKILFPNLRELSIFLCPRLRDVTWTMQLPCLNLLSIQHCDELRELISDVGSSTSSLSTFGLNRLTLSWLPNLNYITRQPLSFPYLEFIHVYGCEKLKRISPSGVQVDMDMSTLKEIIGQRDWLDNMQLISIHE